MISKENQNELLQLARLSIRNYVNHRFKMQTREDDELNQPCGVFVTLKKEGDLRGCIGRVASSDPLVESVQHMAISSAVNDQRFSPVSHDEIDDLSIEISVLSPPEPIDVEDIELGVHGLILQKGIKSGLLLPQVPIEHHWDKETYLRQISKKTGLSEDGWKDGQLYGFTAQVFGE